MPLPKADPQGYGSALTYGRRYSLSALIGIVSEDDDDGEAASTGSRGKRDTKAKAPLSQQKQNPPAQNGSSPHPSLSAMPKLDGISYEAVNTTDGKLCIVAKGDTRSKKQLLIQAGFKWSDERKIWWRYADAA